MTDIAPVSMKTNLYTSMGGPRFFFKRGRIVPFAQVLAGAAQLRWRQSLPCATPPAPIRSSLCSLAAA